MCTGTLAKPRVVAKKEMGVRRGGAWGAGEWSC